MAQTQTPQVINASTDPLLAPFRFRSIGPASMGGRIDDIAVAETDPNIIYLGYAVGGVFKSENNGTTFEPVFDEYTTASIGDIAIHPTNAEHRLRRHRRGEQPADVVVRRRHLQDHRRRQDVAAHRPEGDADDRAHRHRSRNPDTVYVAVPGHLFGPNKERGVYKTTDGGKNWTLVKFIDEDTGFTDVAIDPVEPQHPLRGELSAAAHGLLLQRRRSRQRAVEDARTPARAGRS